VAADSGIRIVIGIFLFFLHMFSQDEWVLQTFDVEVAFVNALLKNPVYIKWPKGLKELGLLSQEESNNTCAELTRAMYGNIDSPLQWMKTFTNMLKGMNLQQSATDPCIFYGHRGGKLVLILVLYVDDTLCAGERKEVEWAYKKIEEKIKIVKLGRLKKHLGTIYEWKQDKSGNTYLEASMPKMIDEISEKFEKARGKKAKEYTTPGTPGKTLKKNEGTMVDIDAYRSIVGKIM
jgi:Reverse transcriptase (RNA-dependent DNA polymerase)